jgi:hypothetical protein
MNALITALKDLQKLQQFKNDLSVAKCILRSVGYRWGELNHIKKINGEFKVLLIPRKLGGHEVYMCDWFNINDLLDWAMGKGPVFYLYHRKEILAECRKQNGIIDMPHCPVLM